MNRFLFIITILSLTLPATASNGIRVQNLQTTHNTTYLTVESASLQDQPFSTEKTPGRIFGYFDYSWVNDPWIDLDNDGKNRIGYNQTGGNGSIIKNAQVLNLGFGYLFSDQLQIDFELPVEKITTEDQGPAPINSKLDGSSTSGLGDSRLFAKWNFYDEDQWTMTFIPTLYIPTGFHSVNEYYAQAASCNECESTGIGASFRNFGAGLKFALEKKWEYLHATLNLGIDHHPNAIIEGKKSGEVYKKVDFENNIPLGIAFFIPVAEKFGFNLEASAIDITNKHNEYTHPGEVLAGFRYWPTKHISTHFTVGTGSLENLGGNDPRFILGIKLPLYMPVAAAPTTQTPPIATPEPPLAVRKENKIELLKSVEFDFGSANLTEASKIILDEVASIIQKSETPIRNVKVEGHTDHKGSLALNNKLSKARALSVKKYLIEKGIDEKILTSEGYGPSRPKFDPKTATKQQIDQNRRVEFQITN